MKNKFLNVSVGITLMLFGAGFLLRSVPAATAAPTPETFVEEGTSKIGKYQMMIYTAGSNGRRYGMVWNTETGKSQGYYELGNGWAKDPGLPENPLGQ